jgi:trk system potassium uptake protein TrkH
VTLVRDDAFAPPSARVTSTVLHMVGLALLFAAAGMALSTAVDLVAGGDEAGALALSTTVTTGAGLLLWRGTGVPARVPTASAFAAVSWTWIVVSLFGALPYALSGVLPRLDEALFESVSGFTATGSTVIFPIEDQSLGLLFWRQLTQWYGGMGMIVLAVAVLPFLGVGGLELIRAEAPGETADRLAPRVSGTAKRLWAVYAGLTMVIAVALLLTGEMAPQGGGIGRHVFDAVSHALTALATGGYSPYDTSINAFDSAVVEAVLIVGMLLGAINFTLHWRAFQGEPRAYWRSAELRTFLAILGFAVAAVWALNVADGLAVGRSLRASLFTAVSLMTTTGFGTADFAQWVPAAQLILLYLMVSGAMIGSTSGAVKVIRVRIMAAHARRELQRVLHGHRVQAVKLGATPVAESIVSRIAGFMVLYMLIAGLGVLALGTLGADLPTSAGSVATAMGGVGPGLGDTGPAANFLEITRPARGVMMVLMLLGRLEIFPVLLMFAAVTRSGRRRTAATPVR